MQSRQSFFIPLFFSQHLAFSSDVQRKKAILTAQLCIILFLICLFFGFIDIVNGHPEFLPVELSCLVLTAACYWLNRHGKFNTAKIILILAANATLFAFASSEPVGTGTYMFFITTTLGAFALFGYEQRFLWMLFVLLSVILFLLSYFTDIQIIPEPDYSPSYIRMNMLINFITSLIASVLIMHFLISINYSSEKALRENQEHLLGIAKELNQSKERFELAAKASKAGIYEWNVQTNSIYISPQWKQMLGYEDTDLRDFSFAALMNIVHVEDRENFQEAMNKHFISRQPYQHELRLKTKSGYYKWVSDSGITVFGENGKSELVIGSIIEIDERKMAEQQIMLQNTMLEKINDELDRFVYSASHDLRAPLSSLLGLISIAEKTDRPEEVEQIISMMKQRVHTMEGFIREITDYSRNSRLSVKKEKVYLQKLVSGVVENLKYIDGTEKINIQIEIAPDLHVETDSYRLSTILNNLVVNAIKYHDPAKTDPYVKINAATSNKTLEISVEDNGLGISPEHQDKVYDMFYRASVNSEGSGLGLYIVKECIIKLEGSISLRSELNRGSAFKITVPL